MKCETNHGVPKMKVALAPWVRERVALRNWEPLDGAGKDGHLPAMRFCGLSLFILVVGVVPSFVAAQQASDLRLAHKMASQSLVRIETREGHGSGWVTELNGEKIVVTNRHVAGQNGSRVRLFFRNGHQSDGRVIILAKKIDCAMIRSETPIPMPPLRLSDADLIRGQRVVLGGNPSFLRFITSEGIVAGTVAHLQDTRLACGQGHNCIVLDAESAPGGSGGPVLDTQGRVVGMVFGGMEGTSFSIAIHAQGLARVLRAVESKLRKE